MKQKFVTACIITLFVLLAMHCKPSANHTVKSLAGDPFEKTLVPSRYFMVDARNDTAVVGESGTVIVFPKGCFKYASGDIVADSVKIELAEALTLEEMLLSNLTTTSEGKLLETDGMIYFNATANGKQLSVNTDMPIHIEIPTRERKAGMMAYKGTRDANGNMNWNSPVAIETYLVTVDINTLDFLPKGFKTEVDKGMPYKQYTSATNELTDSLYYLLSVSDGRILAQGFVPTHYNEPYYNKDKKVVNGRYTESSFEVAENSPKDGTTNNKESSTTGCGIDPAIIRVIKSEAYQNTFIATREFEARLKVIFETCNNRVLEAYILHLDKNLYEADSMAAGLLEGSKYQQRFLDFSKQRLTKVRQNDAMAGFLKTFYARELAKVKSEMEKDAELVSNALRAKNEEARTVAREYKELLLKRETYRMETYGFNWTSTGWINVDNGTLPKDWYPQPLAITVENGKQFNRVYTYVVYTSIKSLYRLNTTDNRLFYVGNEEEKKMLMPKKKTGVAIAIGYAGEAPSLAIRTFETGSEPELTLTLAASSIEKVKEAIRPYNNYTSENSIDTDLAFMAKFYEEEERQKALKKESEFILRLWNIAYPCCASQSDTIKSQKEP